MVLNICIFILVSVQVLDCLGEVAFSVRNSKLDVALCCLLVQKDTTLFKVTEYVVIICL